MENPKTLETLEVENPIVDKTPNEASGSSAMNEIFSGLASVSDICSDFGFENSEVEARVVRDERETGGSGVRALENLVDEKIEKVCLVNDVCVSDVEREANLEDEKIDSVSLIDEVCVGDVEKKATLEPIVTLMNDEENKTQPGFVESKAVGNVDDETRVAVNDEGSDDGVGTANSVEEGCLASNGCVGKNVEDENRVVNDEDRTCGLKRDEDSVEERCVASNGCVDDTEKELKLEEETTIDRESSVSMSVSNGLPAATEVLSEGISLYVDIAGSLIGSVTKEGMNVDDAQGLSFPVGDIVWVKTRNKTWWPGKVCDPADAPESAERSGPGNNLLVGYYGVSHFAWCSPSQLKLFHENFGVVVAENKAQIFVGAVEKAVDEFGGLVKSEMTCSCRSKSNQPSSNRGLGELSALNFEPVEFLERIKSVAEVGLVPSALDFTVTKNRLSAFYCSMGHRQLPMDQLVEKSDTKKNTEPPQSEKKKVAKEGTVSSGGSRKRKPEKESKPEVEDNVDSESPSEKMAAIGNSSKKRASKGLKSSGSQKRKPEKEQSKPEVEDSSGGNEEAKNDSRGGTNEAIINKGFDSRERKKSRYLSYPYVNFEPKGSKTDFASETSKDLNQDLSSPSSISKSNSGERFWKKWHSMFAGGSHSEEITDSASAELLCELRRVAMHGLFLKENEAFSSVGWFFSRFRVSVYYNESGSEKFTNSTVVGQNEANGTEETVAKDKPKRKRAETKDNPNKSVSAELENDEKDLLSTMMMKKKKKKKKKEEEWKEEFDSARSKTKPLSGLSDVSISVAGLGVSVKDALQINNPLPLSPCTKKPKKQRKKKRTEEKSVTEEKITIIPDLNGSSGVVSFSDPPQATSEAKPVSAAHTADVKPCKLVVDLQFPREELQPKTDSHVVSVFSDPASKKRKVKNNNAVSPIPEQHIPDLNRTTSGAETNGVAAASPEAATQKPKRKKRKVQPVILNYPRNPSFTGTALILTFSPGSPTPSREDLVSSFRKFGQLAESDTKVFEQSAQVVFGSATDAAEAMRSLEKDSPFGPSLAGFRLHQQAPSKVPVPVAEPAQVAEPAAAAAAGGQPPLEYIKQNLEMMTAMLENSGDNLTQEMRAKLESEIKALLTKVSSMAGSCS